MLLFLNELVLERFEEHAELVDQVLDVLLLLVHCLVARERLGSDVGTGKLHGDDIVSLLHLRHVDKLAEEVAVEVQHVRSVAAGATLDLLVVQEEHFVDVARLVSCNVDAVLVDSFTFDSLSQLLELHGHIVVLRMSLEQFGALFIRRCGA